MNWEAGAEPLQQRCRLYPLACCITANYLTNYKFTAIYSWIIKTRLYARSSVMGNFAGGLSFKTIDRDKTSCPLNR